MPYLRVSVGLRVRVDLGLGLDLGLGSGLGLDDGANLMKWLKLKKKRSIFLGSLLQNSQILKSAFGASTGRWMNVPKEKNWESVTWHRQD